jgi:hypothetical protein
MGDKLTDISFLIVNVVSPISEPHATTATCSGCGAPRPSRCIRLATGEGNHVETKKRLTDFLVEQTAAPEATKQRAREHADDACALADFAIKTLQDHVTKQIAALEATDAHA